MMRIDSDSTLHTGGDGAIGPKNEALLCVSKKATPAHFIPIPFIFFFPLQRP